MEFVAILRLLSRRPVLVGIGAVAAILIGLFAAGGETNTTGTASARIVMDTAKSQLIHQAPTGAETLNWRTVMLADLAGSKPLTDRIAKEVGIRGNQLVVVHPELSEPVLPTTLPSRAAIAAGVIPEKYVLTVQYDELLPIIALHAEAPSRAAAVRLVEAAAGALKETGTPTPGLEDAGTPAYTTTPGIQGLVVENVGPVRSRAIIVKPQPLIGAAVAIVLFGLWSAAVALIPRLLSAWRGAGRRPQPV